MPDHLRYAGLPFEAQRAALLDIVAAQPVLTHMLEAARDLDLPDCWLVSGALYNTVWNVLTARDALHGVRDIDLFYCDGTDLSYAAEDRVIRRVTDRLGTTPVPVEVRNQARVHLWYRRHFGCDRAPLRSSREAIDQFAARTHAVGVRLANDGTPEVYAPYGLDHVFGFRHVPNRVLENRRTYERKSARIAANWPEVTIEPW